MGLLFLNFFSEIVVDLFFRNLGRFVSVLSLLALVVDPIDEFKEILIG